MKAGKEFIDKWVRRWMQDDAEFIRGELIKMLQELGVEIKTEDKKNRRGQAND
jgi:hypothetical protein